MSACPTHFESFTWGEFVQTVSAPPNPSIPCVGSTIGTFKDTRTHKYSHALGLAKTGWPEGLQLITEVTSKIDSTLGVADAITPSYCEAGDEVDVGLHLEGDPESMIEYVMLPRQRPVVRLMISTATSNDISAETIIARGAVILSAIDHVERTGVRVEVDGVCGIFGHRDRSGARRSFITTIRLKNAEDPIDRDLLAFALCHPSMQRRLMFRLHEVGSLSDWVARGGANYGHPANITALHRKNAVYVPSMVSGDTDYADPAAATRRMIAQLTQ